MESEDPSGSNRCVAADQFTLTSLPTIPTRCTTLDEQI